MSSTVRAVETPRFARIDDYLGPGDRRFFGEGYKRGEHRVGDITVEAGEDGAGAVRGRASVAYPTDWSRKGRTDQRPHLSTVDVLLLTARLGEMHLAHTLGLDEDRRAGSWLRRIRIRAGRSPVEDELQGFGIEARPVETRPSPDAAERTVSVLDTRIGTLTARVEIDHPAGRPGAGGGRYESVEDLLGDDARRLYGIAYKDRRQIIEDVVLGEDGHSARAGVRFATRSGAPDADLGLEGRHQPSVSMIDAFVVGLQLGQVMLYELDGVSRAESDTLWMRQTVLETDRPSRPLAPREETTAHLRGAAVLASAKGESWRRADIVGELGGVRLRCSVAHRLPVTGGAGS